MIIPTWAANLAYLLASVLFIYGIKGMTHPRTAVRGNMLSSIAMLIAIVVTAFSIELAWPIVVAGLVVGGMIGLIMAIRVQMTGMPQMVALFNGLGGGASVFVAWAAVIAAVNWYQKINAKAADLTANAGESVMQLAQAAREAGVMVPYPHQIPFGTAPDIYIGYQTTIASVASGLIGSVTLLGSLVAFGKLAEWNFLRKPIALPMHQLINVLLLLVGIALGVLAVMFPVYAPWFYIGIFVVGCIMGVTLVIPIGGADMPVVISLLNSYSGIAAAATGFVISNNMLIIAGSLVGASGLILTAIMCKAMNRSLTNVLFGRIDASGAASADDIYEGKIKSISADEVAMMLDGAQNICVVPGYGMAVAQAQHAVRDLYRLLSEREVNVEFAIHPVAGRMPGHMNVLLAEVDIPYEKLVEMDQINSRMGQMDMAIVLGANDVVNPDAREADSPIAGMPILNVDEARTVVVVKRSLSPGFAGIPNPLFAKDNTLMLFADGKAAIEDMVTALKES